MQGRTRPVLPYIKNKKQKNHEELFNISLFSADCR
jgi:hypothetical protein